MKLTDLDNKKTPSANKALAEQYEMPFDMARMSLPATKSMLRKVRGLLEESKKSKDFYKNTASPSYMKLVFMEQALSAHYKDLNSRPRARIVVENEEVEKSQVVLAAQDLVDSVQKMLEEVSDMLVKELPALVNGVQSEIGVNESDQFNSEVSQSLTGLQSAISQAKTSLQGALNGITGQGGAGGFDAGAEPGAEMGAEPGAEMGAEPGAEMGAEAGAEMGAEAGAEMPPEEPEAPIGGVGREKR